MDEQPAAILASFSDYRRIPARKVLRLSFEVPLEQEAETFARIGFPGPHESTWFAIARAEPSQEHREPPPKPAPVVRSSAVRDAALFCKEEPFWAFLEQMPGGKGRWQIRCEEGAAIAVREACGVTSRRELTPGSEALRKWNKLVVDYGDWRAKHWIPVEEFACSTA